MPDVEDREEHKLRSALVSAGMFGIGYSLKDNYLKSFNINKKYGAAIGAVFSLIPAMFSEKQDFMTSVATAGILAGANLNSDKINKLIINNVDLFQGTLKNLKKVNETTRSIEEFFIESRQKLTKERKENQGYIEGIYELSREVLKSFIDKKPISKSKAYSVYKEVANATDEMTLEEFTRLGKKIPYELSDYITARRKFDKKIADTEFGNGMFTATGFFSKLEKGKLGIDFKKFLDINANNIASKIDFLDNNVPKILTDKNAYDPTYKGLESFLESEGMGFFNDVITQGVKTNNNQLTYRKFMELKTDDGGRLGDKLFQLMGGKDNKYFNKNGQVKYLDLLGDQVFSDNLMINDKGKIVDMTWFKPKNLIIDFLRSTESAIRPFFKTLPLSENKQFSIFESLNLDTKLYNSIYGNQISKFYMDPTDNIDLVKTRTFLIEQITNMSKIKDQDYRKKNGYRSIKEAMYTLNLQDNYYNPLIGSVSGLDKSIRLLKAKLRNIDDQIEKTGGIKKHSSIVGRSNDIDKAHFRYFINIDSKTNEYKLLEKTVNKGNAVFFNNKMYLKNNGVFEKQKGQYVFDLSRETRIMQAKRAGEYYTTRANRAGKYVEEKDAPVNFDIYDFKNIYENKSPEEAFKYLYNSDLNITKNGFKDSDNILDEIKEPFERVRNYLKTQPKNKQSNYEIASLLFGIEKHSKSFYDKYSLEVDDVFKKMMVQYDQGIEEINELLKTNRNSFNAFKRITGTSNLYNSKNQLKSLDSFELSKIVGKNNTSKNIESTLRMSKAFDIANDKYNTVDVYHSITDVGKALDNKAKKKFGDLFNVSHFKEDIIINSFGKENNYSDFVDRYGDLFKDNIMFNKETLFNKNRITNINVKKPSIVKRAFSDISIHNTVNENIKSVVTMFDGGSENTLGTNLGMFLSKGIESFENSLSVLGVGKLSQDNMQNTAKYFFGAYTKRILPFHLAVAGYGMINSAVDAILPDSVPIFGEGLTSAMFKGIAATRMAIQVAINATGLGSIFRKVEEMFPGVLTDNGLLSPLQLSATNEDTYATLFEGKEVEDKKNRFWYSSGRQQFEGGEVKNIRPHLLYLGQHRTAGIYENKVQRFFRQDFLPTKLLWTIVDPYMEERINAEKRPVAKSMDLFNSELPIIGGFINTLGKIIKPTKYFNKDEWYVENGIMKNPAYEGQENTPEYLNYNTDWKLTKSLSKAFEDIQSIIGMRGYILGQAHDYIFGDDSMNNEYELETLNSGQSLLDRYNNLNLGGMFGMTEPIRRIIGSEPISKSISPLKNNYMPDWMPKNYFKNVSFGNVYNEIPFGEFILPGEVYERYNKLHPDDTGEYGVADRLKILSKVAPFSKEFRHTKLQAIKRLNEMSQEEQQIVYQSLSYAEKWRERDIERNEREEVAIKSQGVTIKRIESPFEFYGTDNKRYKLSGVGLDFFDGRNSDEITNQMVEMQKLIKRGSTINGYIAQDSLTAVNTDNAGEYIEIYVPELDKFNSLKKESYLRYSYTSDYDITDSLLYAFKNAKKPASLEKIWGSKDTYARYYYENILDPSFKNWNAPVESFISPIFDTASTGFKGYLSSMNTSIRMGDFGNPVMPTLTTMAYMKGMIFGPNSVNRIDRENYFKDLAEYAKSQLDIDTYRGNFNSSIYNMSESDGLSKMKNYLTPMEKKYLDNIANETNKERRQKMYDVSSNRMKMVLNQLWKRQAEYNGGSYISDNIELQNFENEDIAKYNATNETAYSEALFKYEMGFDLTTFEKQSISLYGTNHLKQPNEKNDNAEYIDRMLGKNSKRQVVLSTIMTEDMLFFGY